METAKNEIEEINEQRVKAIKLQDVSSSVSMLADDVISFDLLTPLQNIGKDAVVKRLENWFSEMAELKNFEMTNVNIDASEELAFCSSLNHIIATNSDGTKNDMWWRETTCYKKINGEWKIKHIHASSPFDMETGETTLDAKPIK